jgi:hypothetical protein
LRRGIPQTGGTPLNDDDDDDDDDDKNNKDCRLVNLPSKLKKSR